MARKVVRSKCRHHHQGLPHSRQKWGKKLASGRRLQSRNVQTFSHFEKRLPKSRLTAFFFIIRCTTFAEYFCLLQLSTLKRRGRRRQRRCIFGRDGEPRRKPPLETLSPETQISVRFSLFTTVTLSIKIVRLANKRRLCVEVHSIKIKSIIFDSHGVERCCCCSLEKVPSRSSPADLRAASAT